MNTKNNPKKAIVIRDINCDDYYCSDKCRYIQIGERYDVFCRLFGSIKHVPLIDEVARNPECIKAEADYEDKFWKNSFGGD